MNRIRSQVIVFIAVYLHSICVQGATVVLHEHANPKGTVVYLGDVADISAAAPSEVDELATTPLIPTPSQGVHEYLQASQIRELLISRGIDSRHLSFAGAEVVEIGTLISQNTSNQASALPRMAPEEVEEVVMSAIEAFLIETTGHERWQVDLSLSGTNLTKVTALGRDVVVRSGRSPRSGTQRFVITAPGRREFVALNARVVRLREAVVTVRKIERGDLIGVGDVEVRLIGDNLPSDAMGSIDEVLGKEALRTIAPESIVQSGQFRLPLQVQRGETVEVFSRTGGITVKTFAVVREDGSLGDLVQVETLDQKERFVARVSGWKHLDVLPTGATAQDYATLHRSSLK